MALRADISHDLGWFRFEAKNIDIRILDAAGTPVDLTGVSLDWTVRRQAGSDVVLLGKTSDSGITAVAHTEDVGGTKSVARIAVDTGDYGSLEAGVWYHELWELEDDGSRKQVLAYGDAVVNEASEEA